MTSIPSLKKSQRRWLAEFTACFTAHDLEGQATATRLGATSHFGPLRVQRPFFPEGADLAHIYLLHPPGGLVGGDHLNIELEVQSSAKVLVTTPSAGKLYRNITDMSQGQTVSATIADGGVLEWLPQENILFDGATGELCSRIALYGTAIYSGWEIICLGRPEGEKPFRSGSLRQRLEITRDGSPLFIDQINFSADDAMLANRAGLADQRVTGAFVVTEDVLGNRELTAQIHAWQERINAGEAAGNPRGLVAVTQKPGVFVARLLTDKAEWARDRFQELWTQLRPAIVQRPACVPRIWRT